MNALVPLTGGGMPSLFQTQAGNLPDMNTAAGQGLTSGFGVIGYKGRNWRIKHKGEEILLMDERRVPIPVLEVVIVGISSAIAKQYYEKSYGEGDSESPDCFSTTGIAPDPVSPKPQHTACALCPNNRFGSKITDAGKKAKACQDSRRIAVVPSADIMNEDFGGPLLLRIPPMSLNNLAAYTKQLSQHGGQPYAVATALGFDYEVAYPLINFSAIRWLDDEQAGQVIQVINDPQIERMLNEGSDETAEAPAAPAMAGLAGGAPAAGLAQAVAQAVAQPAAPAPIVQAAPAPVAPAAPAPAAVKRGAFGAAPAPMAQAPAAPAPVPQAAAAPAPVKRSAFGGAAPAAAPVTLAAVGAVTAPAPAAVTVIQGAPTDMESAIDALLQ